LQHAFRGNAGQQRRTRRAFERVSHTEHCNSGEYHRRIQPAGETAPGEKYRCRTVDELANLHEASAVVTVGRVARDEDKQCSRDELHQADHAERKCTIGQRINLPAHGDSADQEREFG
jgi:hypothetical protein